MLMDDLIGNHCFLFGKGCLTNVLLNPGMFSLEISLDQDQLAFDKAM